jgi:DMSO/TMAO reductase YedYZ molybdopterin-dependent catalytic subunit
VFRTIVPFQPKWKAPLSPAGLAPQIWVVAASGCYTKSQITPLKNNYNGSTPDPGHISGWKLTLDGLASGLSISLDIRNLLNRFSVHEQITRLVCVEGWSAIA